MKWQKLDGKKDPTPDGNYIVINKNGQWDKMKLEEIKITSRGKTYVFHDFEGNFYSDMTHYIDIEPPKE